MSNRYNHVIAFDDAPFERAHRGDVLVVGAVYTGLRLEGVLSGNVRRDGASATRALADLVRCSHLRAHSRVPEPLRTAHLIASGIARGASRHRA
jgi:uncharacterized protein